MPFFYSKPIGGKNFGTSVHADRHGIRRGPWRFRIGRFNCFSQPLTNSEVFYLMAPARLLMLDEEVNDIHAQRKRKAFSLT
ncbi:hypothetical protein K4K54_012232 [Colletotrichum sp. SAR 10_86]|nr:hypothetical protein K4K54_012232 [Colletotrichum sp. SAR 10_86]